MWYSLDNDFKHEGDVVLNICGTNNTHVTLIDRAGKCSKRDKTESKLGPSGFWEIFDHPGFYANKRTFYEYKRTFYANKPTFYGLSTVCLRSGLGLVPVWNILVFFLGFQEKYFIFCASAPKYPQIQLQSGIHKVSIWRSGLVVTPHHWQTIDKPLTNHWQTIDKP